MIRQLLLNVLGSRGANLMCAMPIVAGMILTQSDVMNQKFRGIGPDRKLHFVIGPSFYGPVFLSQKTEPIYL